MPHIVVVDEFEGPLGLLLELVERGKMEVTTISVSHVAEHYLQRLTNLPERSPNEISEFLELGCRLLYIKSLALLPRDGTQQQIDELRQLNRELSEYHRFREAARQLGKRASHRTYHRSSVESLPAHELPLPQLELKTLSEIFQQAIRRIEPSRPSAIIRRELSQEDMVERLLHRLRDGAIDLGDELDRATDRLEIIVLFTALLELIKSNRARVTQLDQFAPISIEAIV